MDRRRFAWAVALLAVAACGLLLHLFFGPPRRVELTVSAGRDGGTYLPLARSIASAVTKAHPHLRLRVIESDGSLDNLGRLERGEADLALVQNDVPGGADPRVLAPLHLEVLHFLVPLGSAVQELVDLRGLRVAVGAEDSGTRLLVDRLMGHFGLAEGSFVRVFADGPEAARRLLAGEVDAILSVTGLQAPFLAELIAAGQVRYVGLGDPGDRGGPVEGFRLAYPYVQPYTIPEWAHGADGRGGGRPAAAVGTLALRSLLVARPDVPEEAAFLITRELYAHRAALIRRHPAAAGIHERFDPSQLQFPLHPGARAYFDRNAPSFLEKYAEPMAFILSFAIALAGIGAAVRSWIMQRMKDRIDVYYLRLDEILEKLADARTAPAELAAIEVELARLRHEAVHQLVEERLHADESFSIFQSLLADGQAMVHARLRRGDEGESESESESETERPGGAAR